MKKFTAYMVLPLAALALSISGCKKDDNSTQQPATISSSQLFNYSDSWGLLAGVKTVTTQNLPVVGTVNIDLGTAVVAFNTAAGATTYQDAGTVTCNTKALNKQSNNSYVFQPEQSDPTGIDFSSGSSWNVGGAGNVPAFTHTFGTFPSTPTITSNKDEVNLASGYTFTISGVSGADSILFILASGNSYVEKRLGGNATSATFSAAELSTLQASSNGLIQVTPYTYEANSTIMPGKKLYFINQVTISDFAEFK